MPGAPGIDVTTGGQVNSITVTDNDVSPVIDVVTIYRTLPGVETVILTKTLTLASPGHGAPPEGTFSDYTWASGKLYEYVAIGYDSSGNASPPSPVATLTGTLTTAVITSVAKNATDNFGGVGLEIYNQWGQRRNYEIENQSLIMPGRGKPVIKVSPIVGFSVDIPVLVPLADKATVIPALDSILQSNQVFTYRDALGDLVFGTFGNNSVDLRIKSEFTLVMIETDYKQDAE